MSEPKKKRTQQNYQAFSIMLQSYCEEKLKLSSNSSKAMASVALLYLQQLISDINIAADQDSSQCIIAKKVLTTDHLLISLNQHHFDNHARLIRKRLAFIRKNKKKMIIDSMFDADYVSQNHHIGLAQAMLESPHIDGFAFLRREHQI